jgi:hypothetical protein
MFGNFIPWMPGFFILDFEIAKQINSGDVSIVDAMSCIDSVVLICDKAIAEAMSD